MMKIIFVPTYVVTLSTVPWGPSERQSSGFICIWNIFQLLFWWWRHLVKKMVFFKLKPDVTFIILNDKKRDIITVHSRNSIIFKEVYSLKSWFWIISMKIRSVWTGSWLTKVLPVWEKKYIQDCSVSLVWLSYLVLPDLYKMCLLLFLLNDYDYYDSLSRGQPALVGEL